MLPRPARCADLLPRARECGHTGLGERARLEHKAAGRPVMTPRHAGLQADDAVASHRAAGGAGPSIEGARTHAHLFSRGAVVGFAAFRAAIEASKNERPRPLDDCFFYDIIIMDSFYVKSMRC